MPLVGGGGAGNTAGGNPAGTGSGINYVGNHAYAYSGNVAVDNNITTLLQFNTQNNYVMANIQLEYFDASSDNMKFIVNICLLKNITAEDFFQSFMEKSDKNIQRFLQSDWSHNWEEKDNMNSI